MVVAEAEDVAEAEAVAEEEDVPMLMMEPGGQYAPALQGPEQLLVKSPGKDPKVLAGHRVALAEPAGQ